MRKIMFAISSLGSGGAERVVSTLANELTARGYAVSILLIASSDQVYPLSEQIQVISLNCEENAEQSLLKRYPDRLRKIRTVLKETTPDAVISFMSETSIDVCLSALGLPIPILVSERNDPSIDPPSRVKRLLRRFAYLRSDGFVFQTPDAQAYFSSAIQKRSRIILNPLASTLPEPYAGPREKRIVAVGRLNPQKNYPLLVDAFREFLGEHPDYVLEVYGRGDLEQQLRTQISRLGLEERVLLKGFCSRVHDAIRNAAFFVMSSDFEGMPNALMEAMALGLPCICTDCPCGGPRMLIRDGENGLLVPVGDSASLANAMGRLADNPELAETLGKQAALLREQTNVNAIVDQWQEMIDAAANRKQPR